MGAEKITYTKVSDLPSLVTPKKSEGRVDINILLNRARKLKEKETKTNLVFFGLTVSLIFVVGLILSF